MLLEDNLTAIKRKIGLIILAALLLTPIRALALTADQQAFVSSGQDSNVITDNYFIDINSMTVQQIQDFLTANNSYLQNFVDNSSVGRGRTAAQVIWDSAHGKYEAGMSTPYNGITVNETTGTVNPAVILVYLQKEQSLITNPSYNQWAMTASMGYFCYPGVTGDNNGNNCKDIYEGFANQVANGAWQLRYNYERAQNNGFSDYQVGQVFHTSDGYDVTLSNRSTASVYRYTPYVFDSSYNVWNLFYNTFNFDQGGGVVIPPPQPTSNDTTAYNLQTYKADAVTLTGQKTTDSKAYLGDTLIADLNTNSWTTTITPTVGITNQTITYKDASNNVINSKSIQIELHKTADINNDGKVDLSDLSLLAASWGAKSPSNVFLDLNGDGVVDILDLSILASNWNG